MRAGRPRQRLQALLLPPPWLLLLLLLLLALLLALLALMCLLGTDQEMVVQQGRKQGDGVD